MKTRKAVAVAFMAAAILLLSGAVTDELRVHPPKGDPDVIAELIAGLEEKRVDGSVYAR